MTRNLIVGLTTYGKRLKIPIKLILIGVCLVTPFTNWLIPIIIKYIKGVWYI